MGRSGWAALMVVMVLAGPAAAEKVVFLAGGDNRDHPEGTHTYEQSLRYLQRCVETSPNVEGVETELHVGWPEDPSTFEDADTIVLFSNGSDHALADHPFLRDGRLELIREQMDRGCGLVVLHWATFFPAKLAPSGYLDWVGGFFDYETGEDHERNWYSRINFVEARCEPNGEHPIAAGVEPFTLHDEWYWRIRFREEEPRATPILRTEIPQAEEPQVTAWALQRASGGRGFGCTGGHFHENFRHEQFGRMILNAIIWTAGMDVPDGGVAVSEKGDASESRTENN